MLPLCLQLVPILRAGLVLLEQTSTLLPAQQTYHVGLVRNEETLQARLLAQQPLLHSGPHPVCCLTTLLPRLDNRRQRSGQAGSTGKTAACSPLHGSRSLAQYSNVVQTAAMHRNASCEVNCFCMPAGVHLPEQAARAL